MGQCFATERRLVSETEYGQIVKSHYPEVEALPEEELRALARWLREARDRARGVIAGRRRARRGKGGTPEAGAASERGLAAKKQVYARALKRVNARLDRLSAERKRASMQARMEAALARRREAPVHHPDAGMTAGRGMAAKGIRRSRQGPPGIVVGSVSQRGKAAQARRDARG